MAAGGVRGVTPSAAFVAFWLAFASQQSGLPIPLGVGRPAISLADHAGSVPVGLHEKAVGLTDANTGHITLYLGWRGISPRDNCIVAHELVHWLQIMNRQHFARIEGMEPAAYRVEATCLASYGERRDERWALEEARRLR